MDLALVADKGGVGKSLLSFHVATRLKQLGHDVGLVDLDRRWASSKWAAVSAYVPSYPLALDADAALPAHAVRVWDTPAHPGEPMRAALAETCDLVLVVCTYDMESQLAAAELYRDLSGRAPDLPVRVVVNQVHPTGNEGPDALESLAALGAVALPTCVRSYKCYSHARWQGKAVCDYPYSKADEAWSDIRAVTAEVLALVKESTHA